MRFTLRPAAAGGQSSTPHLLLLCSTVLLPLFAVCSTRSVVVWWTHAAAFFLHLRTRAPLRLRCTLLGVCMSGKRNRVESEELDSPQDAKEGKMSASPMAVDPPKAIDEDLHRCVTLRGVTGSRAWRRGKPAVAVVS